MSYVVVTHIWDNGHRLSVRVAKLPIYGNSDMNKVSTSHIERQSHS